MGKAERRRLGLEVKRVRRAAGMTQTALGEALGVHKVTVANWERGAYAVGGDTLAALEQLLGVRVMIVSAEEAAKVEAGRES